MHNPFEKQDEQFMKLALEQAKKAAVQHEVPVGAVVVDPTGTVIARAFNQVEHLHTQRAHAEALALELAGKKRGTWRLNDCWLYVTLEPCAMCIHLILLSRIGRVVFGATSPLFGYRLDKEAVAQVYKVDAPEIVSGVCADKAAIVLKQFFSQKRKSGCE